MKRTKNSGKAVLAAVDKDTLKLGALLDSLIEGGHLEETMRGRALKIASRSRRDESMPVLTRILLALGAWLSAIFLIGFIEAAFLAGIRSPVASFLVIGIIQIGAATGMSLSWKEAGSYSSRLFLQQFAFAMMISGKIMTVAGCVMSVTSSAESVLLIAAVASMILTMATFLFFKLDGERLLSFLSSIALFGIWIAFTNEYWLFGVFAALMVLLLWLSFVEKRVPLVWGYSGVLALPVMVVFISMSEIISRYGLGAAAGVYFMKLPVAAVISISSAAFCIRASRGYGEGDAKVLTILAAVSGILGVVSMPGIVTAIGLMVFGHELRNRIITGLGAVFLPVFLFLFYYRLDVTLLVKSGVLVGSGLLLLAARYFIVNSGWVKDA